MSLFVNTYYRMALDFIIKQHPWNQVKENSSLAGPKPLEIEVMKGIMDGHSIQDIAKNKNITVTNIKKMLVDGMRTANVKNLYELIVWGLRSGIIKDEPKNEIAKQLQNPHYADWALFLNQTVTGNVDMPKSSQQNLKKSIAQKFHLGSSDAAIIRFAFQVMNPINPPKSFRGYKPFVSHFVKTGVSSKYAVIPSKFKPAEIDPNLHPTYQPLKMGKTIGTKSGSIQMALKILGIPENVIKVKNKSLSFWDNKPEFLWHILELARSRFQWEISHAHPDNSDGGNVNRAKQVNVAWKFVKEMFKRRGYELHK